MASVLYSLPFSVQPIAAAFSQVEPSLREASATLGASGFRTFTRITLPLSIEGVIAGLVLSFAHTVGEFGVVLMVGGNLPGITRTVSISIYDRVQALEYQQANQTALVLLAFSLLVLMAVYGLRRRSWAAAPCMTLDLTVTKRLGPGFALDVTLAAPPGVTMIFGASGSGKTTLLRCLAGLTRPDRGHIAVGDRVLFDSTAGVDVAVQDRRVGYVFQQAALFPHSRCARTSSTACIACPMRSVGSGSRRLRSRFASPGSSTGGRRRSPAASASVRPWPVRSSLNHRCCCSTSRSPRSITPSSRGSWTTCAG